MIARSWSIIVNYRTSSLVIDTLASLAKELLPSRDKTDSEKNPGNSIATDIHNRSANEGSMLESHGVLVVDNNSGDGSASKIQQAIIANNWQNWAEVLPLKTNGGFAAGNNAGIKYLWEHDQHIQYFHLLNPDTLVQAEAVQELRKFLDANPRVGIAGSQLLNADGTHQTSAFRFHNIVSQFDYGLRIGIISRLLKGGLISFPAVSQPMQSDWVSGASMMIRREVFEKIGFMDEKFFLYFEETDFCRRARNHGFLCYHIPASKIIHLEGQSTGIAEERQNKKRMPKYWFESRRRYFRKNYGWFNTWLINIAFAFPFALWRFRRWVLRKPDPDPPYFLWDFIRYSFGKG